MSAIGAAHQWTIEPGGVLTAVWRPWAAKLWRYSTTLGHAIIYQPATRMPLLDHPAFQPSRVQHHEHTHVKQGEDSALRYFLIGLGVLVCSGWMPAWVMAAILWANGYGWKSTNFVSAWLRGGDPYRDAEHERSAYAQTDIGPDGKAWHERQSKERSS